MANLSQGFDNTYIIAVNDLIYFEAYDVPSVLLKHFWNKFNLLILNDYTKLREASSIWIELTLGPPGAKTGRSLSFEAIFHTLK